MDRKRNDENYNELTNTSAYKQLPPHLKVWLNGVMHELNRLEDYDNKPKVVYVCDQLQCENCSNPDCKHTFNIKHAKNFKKVANTNYYEEKLIKTPDEVVKNYAKKDVELTENMIIAIQEVPTIEKDSENEDKVNYNSDDLFIVIFACMSFVGFILGLISVCTLFGG